MAVPTKTLVKQVLFFCFAFALLLSGLGISPVSAETAILHSFVGGVNDGNNPEGSLVISGDTLYGMTPFGGDNDDGVIFSVKTDGTDYSILHEFTGGASDGCTPLDSLLVFGETLYGMTNDCGADWAGTIFTIQTDGSAYDLIYSFDYTNGGYPYGTPVLSGDTLYGLTKLGGANSSGTIFSVNTDGTNYNKLHSFLSGTTGRYPYGSALLYNNTIFGISSSNGAGGQGSIVSIGIDGSDLSVVHDFSGGEADGAESYGSLLEVDGVLYGMTSRGGDDAVGVIFAIDPDGNNFRILHEFSNDLNDGKVPYDSLVEYGGKLYGMTSRGGAFSDGTVFSILPDGTHYAVLHSFSLEIGDGASPYGSPIVSEGTLYGMTMIGGEYGEGAIFSLELDLVSPVIQITPVTDPTSDVTPSVTGIAIDASWLVAEVEYQVDSISGPWLACVATDGTFDEAEESYTCDVSSTLADGMHTVYVRATDSVGNTTESGSYASDVFTVDTVLPPFPVSQLGADVTVIPGVSVTVNVPRPTFVGVTEPYAHVVLTIYSDPIVGEADADGDGNWSWTPTEDIPAGTHRVVASSTDLAGNVGTGEFTLSIGLADTGNGIWGVQLGTIGIAAGVVYALRRRR